MRGVTLFCRSVITAFSIQSGHSNCGGSTSAYLPGRSAVPARSRCARPLPVRKAPLQRRERAAVEAQRNEFALQVSDGGRDERGFG
jgi:hypothetical protein